MKLIKKPILTLLVLFFVIAAIIYLQPKTPILAQNPGNAPDFQNIKAWINSEPLTIEKLPKAGNAEAGKKRVEELEKKVGLNES